MRPARKGPENPGAPAATSRSPSCFNEAGPQGAGKPPHGREAGGFLRRASMRPARKGPENLPFGAQDRRTAYRFNEAGPQGAGKPCAASRWALPAAALQ